jgi:hypothetical protein
MEAFFVQKTVSTAGKNSRGGWFKRWWFAILNE